MNKIVSATLIIIISIIFSSGIECKHVFEPGIPNVYFDLCGNRTGCHQYHLKVENASTKVIAIQHYIMQQNETIIEDGIVDGIVDNINIKDVIECMNDKNYLNLLDIMVIDVTVYETPFIDRPHWNYSVLNLTSIINENLVKELVNGPLSYVSVYAFGFDNYESDYMDNGIMRLQKWCVEKAKINKGDKHSLLSMLYFGWLMACICTIISSLIMICCPARGSIYEKNSTWLKHSDSESSEEMKPNDK